MRVSGFDQDFLLWPERSRNLTQASRWFFVTTTASRMAGGPDDSAQGGAGLRDAPPRRPYPAVDARGSRPRWPRWMVTPARDGAQRMGRALSGRPASSLMARPASFFWTGVGYTGVSRQAGR
jgi:hypothetical protein